MSGRTRWATVSVCVCLQLASSLASAVFAAGKPLATIAADGASVWWMPAVETAGITLAIAGPEGEVETFSFAAGELPTFALTDSEGQARIDGSYTWELRIRPAPTEQAPGRPASRRFRRLHFQSGHFSVLDGQVLIPEDETRHRITAEDQVLPDDLIVDGRACIGLSCTNNEAFSGETLLLKQSVVRLRFTDTSTAVGFPSTDWELNANDAGSGGANSFFLRDLTAGTIPFTVSGGAPSNAWYLNASGDVGIGTAVPATALHVSRSASPTIALQQTGGSAREWRLIADGTSFTVRDHTAGTTPLVVGTTIVGTLDAGDAATGSARPANSAFMKMLRHDTDCTALGNPGGGFKAGELCYEEDADRLFVCEPTAGDCDSAAEWRATSSAAGLTVREVDGTPSVAQSGSSTVEFDQADGFVVSSAGGAARIDWSPQADQIALGTNTTGNYAGSSSEAGPATTASALAADPADCAAGQWAAGISATGAASGCTPDDDNPDSDAEVPDAITVTGTVDAKDAGAGTARPANGATIQVLRHDTDCTVLAGAFKAGELCLEEDSLRLFVCKPTAGDCDTASEWVVASDAVDRFVNYGFTPDEHWAVGADQISWTGYATYGGSPGFGTPAFSTHMSSTYQVAHNTGSRNAFRYRPAATSSSIVLRVRATITHRTGAGVMVDDGVDAGDGQGAKNFYRVYVEQDTLGGPMIVHEEYRITPAGGPLGTVQNNLGPTIAYGEYEGIGLRCITNGVWTNYSCSPFTFSEQREPVQFTGGSPAMTWTPVRVGLFARFALIDFGSRSIWDWYDEATN